MAVTNETQMKIVERLRELNANLALLNLMIEELPTVRQQYEMAALAGILSGPGTRRPGAVVADVNQIVDLMLGEWEEEDGG